MGDADGPGGRDEPPGDPRDGPPVDPHDEPTGDPIEGPALLLAAAKASVGPQLLPALVDHVQDHLGPRMGEYRRRYEMAVETETARAFLVEAGHWETLAETVGLERRERDAVKRAHEEQLRRYGDAEGRRDEFETALEIRECVVVGRPDTD